MEADALKQIVLSVPALAVGGLVHTLQFVTVIDDVSFQVHPAAVV